MSGCYEQKINSLLIRIQGTHFKLLMWFCWRLFPSTCDEWQASLSAYVFRRWYSENINKSFQKYPKLSIFYQTIEPPFWGFPYRSVRKESACNAGDLGLILRLRRPPAEGNGKPLQYSCLENLMDRGTWWNTVHGFARIGHDLATKPPPPEPLLQTERRNLNPEFRNICSFCLMYFHCWNMVSDISGLQPKFRLKYFHFKIILQKK